MRLPLALTLAFCAGTLAADPQKISYTRVFPNGEQIGLFIAAADGSDEHPLLGNHELDYDAVWSPDGATLVFTSEREGSADLFRVKPDGTGLERLTDDPAYDDQAAFSPDGKQLVFVSSRNGGFAHLWTMDLATRRVQALTTGTPGGDFRPAWSPDGKWIAFSSDRESSLPFSDGRWERLQVVDLFVIHADGTDLKRITEHGKFFGSPKWSMNGRQLLAYTMTAEQTLANRRTHPEPNNDTRLVLIELATGKMTDVGAAPGVNFAPSFVGDTIGYIRKDQAGPGAGIYYVNGKTGPKGDVRGAAWSPDGSRVVFHRRATSPRPIWKKTFSRLPGYELTLTGLLPSFNPAGDRFVTLAGSSGIQGTGIALAAPGAIKSEVIFSDPKRNVLGPQWSPDGANIMFGIGNFDAFFNGFHGKFHEPADRVEGGAQVAMINADGMGFREVTKGPNNNGFPSMAPDGKRFVYRTFGADGDGLRIMNLETKTVTTLTEGYDNFPLWSPRGDLITFSRQTGGNYEVFTIKPEGKETKQLTFTHGNDAHMAWSPDGEQIAFTSSRMGFKDEVVYTDAPQPYGEIFVMRYDGTNVQQLTDNQWEDGAPAWQPAGRAQAKP
jgi:TolB protein